MSVEYSDSKGRLYYFDNAKFILIFLVVLAHAISPLKSQFPFCHVLWTLINTFHMPAFIFISGYFAKSYIAKDNSLKVQRTTNYVILFLVCQVLVTAFELFVLKERFIPSVFAARSSLWFLQCLIWWHIVLPYVARFKPWLVLVGTVLVALAVGYEKNCENFVSISRTFVHFPFFMLGYYTTNEKLQKLFKPSVRIAGILVFVAAAVLVAVYPEISVSKIITCNYSYLNIRALDVIPFTFKWVARVIFYVSAVLLGASFLSFIPRKKMFFTSLGSKSLSVYILHRFPYLAHLKYAWAMHFDSPLGIAALCLIALAMTVLFSVKPFTLLFDYIQRIRTDKLLKKQ